MSKLQQMIQLESEMIKLPGTIGLGNGNVCPNYIFIGQNPGRDMQHGQRVFSDPDKRAASGIILPILKDIGILEQCYFDNVVKITTEKNVKPSYEDTEKWMPFLIKELEILDNGAKVIAMGKFAYTVLKRWHINCIKISHPAKFFYHGTLDQYRQEIINKLFYL